ncbi:hypothetical protein B7463_g7027, partial [Scytalidium lignicola]
MWRKFILALNGPVGLSQYASEVGAEARELVDSIKHWKETESAKASIVSCQVSVKLLNGQLPSPVTKMGDAIKAVGMLGTIFDDQVSSLNAVKDKVTDTKKAIPMDGGLRGTVILGSVEDAVTKYEEIKKLAKKFHADIRTFSVKS